MPLPHTDFRLKCAYLPSREMSSAPEQKMTVHTTKKKHNKQCDFSCQVDELPKRLQEARITRANFETFTDLWRKVHQLHVATDLTYNSIGHFRRDDMKVRPFSPTSPLPSPWYV